MSDSLQKIINNKDHRNMIQVSVWIKFSREKKRSHPQWYSPEIHEIGPSRIEAQDLIFQQQIHQEVLVWTGKFYSQYLVHWVLLLLD